MKKLLSLIAIIMFAANLSAQNTDVKIKFYTPDIVRVTKTPANSAGAQPSLVVILEPQNVAVKQSQSGGVTTYQSAKLKVTVDNNGKVSFSGIKGGKLLDEGSFSFLPITSGTDKGSFKISQSLNLLPTKLFTAWEQSKTANLNATTPKPSLSRAISKIFRMLSSR